MSLLYTPRMKFVDQNGLPYALAFAYFYLHNTTTPATIYADSGLGSTLTNPLQADAEGWFPAVYLDDNVVYRMVAKDATLVTTLFDIDPVNQLITVGAAQIADGAIQAKLGYTPVDPANAVFTAPARNTFSAPVVALHADDVGFRHNQANVKNTNYTLKLDDAQTLLVHDDVSTFSWTIPNHATVPFPVGAYFFISVQNTGVINLHRDTSVALRTAGSATDGDISCAQYTFARVTQVAVDSWYLK